MRKSFEGYVLTVKGYNGDIESFYYTDSERLDAFEYALEKAMSNPFVELVQCDIWGEYIIPLHAVAEYMQAMKKCVHKTRIELANNFMQRVERFVIKVNDIAIMEEYVLGGHISNFMEYAKATLKYLNTVYNNSYANAIIYKGDKPIALKDCNHLIFMGV